MTMRIRPRFNVNLFREPTVTRPLTREKNKGASQRDSTRFHLKIDAQLLELVRERADALGADVSQYFTALAKLDIKKGGDLPLTTMPVEEEGAPKPGQPSKPASK